MNTRNERTTEGLPDEAGKAFVPFYIGDGNAEPQQIRRSDGTKNEYSLGHDEIIFMNGDIYHDTGNGSMVYIGTIIDMSGWDEADMPSGRIVWNGSHGTLEVLEE